MKDILLIFWEIFDK